MALYHFSTPWDYHGQAGLVVEAKDIQEARERLAAYFGAITTQARWAFDPSHVEKIKGFVYEDRGCDC